MEILKYFYLSLLVIFGIAILIIAFIEKKPFRILFFNALLGIISLTVINILKNFSGVFVPINEITVLLSSTFGLPAVCAFLILPIIFI